MRLCLHPPSCTLLNAESLILHEPAVTPEEDELLDELPDELEEELDDELLDEPPPDEDELEEEQVNIMQGPSPANGQQDT